MRLNVNIKIFQHFINLVYNITYHNPELHPTISIVLDENFSKDTSIICTKMQLQSLFFHPAMTRTVLHPFTRANRS